MNTGIRMSLLNKIAPIVLVASSLLGASAVHAEVSVYDPMSVVLPVGGVLTPKLIEDAVIGKSEELRYLALASLVKNKGPWVLIGSSGNNAKIHISAYLLQTEKEADAINLLTKGDIDGWVSYVFYGGVANDFMLALDSGALDYIKALVKYSPAGVNSTFPLTVNGDEVTPISLLATEKYVSKVYYESVLRALLKGGADPHQPLPNGMTPMVIASSSNNMHFVRVSQAFLAEQSTSRTGLFVNSPLSQVELIEMQAIVDAWLEHSSKNESKYDFKKMHELWIQMILKGYNMAADLIYESLIKHPEFSIDYRDDGGLSGLMASTLSNVYGGNVEYAAKLIQLGADPQILIEVDIDNEAPVRINLIQLALERDNYKTVGLFITKGVNFVTLPDSEDELVLTSAMKQKAFKSAYMIRQAVVEMMGEDKSQE